MAHAGCHHGIPSRRQTMVVRQAPTQESSRITPARDRPSRSALHADGVGFSEAAVVGVRGYFLPYYTSDRTYVNARAKLEATCGQPGTTHPAEPPEDRLAGETGIRRSPAPKCGARRESDERCIDVQSHPTRHPTTGGPRTSGTPATHTHRLCPPPGRLLKKATARKETGICGGAGAARTPTYAGTSPSGLGLPARS